VIEQTYSHQTPRFRHNVGFPTGRVETNTSKIIRILIRIFSNSKYSNTSYSNTRIPEYFLKKHFGKNPIYL
jgi:hypothetical protein